MSRTKISRKEFLGLSAGFGAAAVGAAAPGFGRETGSSPAASRPNILFITVDQLRSFADIPRELPLPTLRRLMREGRSFSNYHVHQAPCGPSRSVIYTGQYVQKTGVYNNPPGEYAELGTGGAKPIELPSTFPTIGKMLREQGYYTAYKGKWHLSVIDQKVKAKTGRGYPDATNALENYGFSDYNFDGDHSGMTWVGFGNDGLIAADSVELLKHFSQGKTGGKPWFFAINFINPHDIMFYEQPGAPPARSVIGTLKEPPLVHPYEKSWNLPLPRSLLADDLSTKPPIQQSLAGAQARAILTREQKEAWRIYQSYYFNCLRDVDTHIATVLDALDRFGLKDNTIVVFTSDHGEQGGAHRLKGKGAYIYKECVRVPLIVRHPRIEGGTATASLGGSVDLAPTLLGFAGMSGPDRAKAYPDLPGVDLAPAIADAKARTDRDKRGILFDYMTPGGFGAAQSLAQDQSRTLIRGVFDGRYKFGRYFRFSEHHTPKDWETLLAHNDLELYDTAADLDELVNLAANPGEHRERILALNDQVNALVEKEIGPDDGAIYPGPADQYKLKS